MPRLFVLIVAAILIYAFLKRQRTDARRAAARDAVERGAREVPSRPVMACAACGVFIPQDEALLADGGLAYCSEAHRLRGHVQPR